jgi:AraC-like DNA-binding protein
MKEQLNLYYEENAVKAIQKKLSKIMFERQENTILHCSFEWEDRLYEIVRAGDKTAVSQILMETIDWEPGTLSEDSLRNWKNIGICFTASLTSRIILDHLMESEDAFSLSDASIQLMEQAHTETEVVQIAMALVYEYIDQRKKYPELEYHQLVKAAKEYVFKNLHSKIEIGAFAKQIGTSPSYLSRLFKQCEGITLQQYIMEERVHRARNLLRFSEYSNDEISQYLGFSSQSHFGKNFKRLTGMTPSQYRMRFNDHYRSRY